MSYPTHRPRRLYRRLPARAVSSRSCQIGHRPVRDDSMAAVCCRQPQNATGAVAAPVENGRYLGLIRLRALIERRPRAAVLRPAGNLTASRERRLLAVGDGAHALRRDAARRQIFAHRLRPARAERDVVFAGAALVGVALDGEGVAVVVVEPLRLLVERSAGLLGELRGIGLEEHAVADIDDEILLAAGSRGRAGLVDLRLGAAGGHQPGPGDGREFGAADDTHDVHSGASIASVYVATGSSSAFVKRTFRQP